MDGYGLTPKGQMDRRWRRPDPPRPKTHLERIRDEAAAKRGDPGPGSRAKLGHARSGCARSRAIEPLQDDHAPRRTSRPGCSGSKRLSDWTARSAASRPSSGTTDVRRQGVPLAVGPTSPAYVISVPAEVGPHRADDVAELRRGRNSNSGSANSGIISSRAVRVSDPPVAVLPGSSGSSDASDPKTRILAAGSPIDRSSAAIPGVYASAPIWARWTVPLTPQIP